MSTSVHAAREPDFNPQQVLSLPTVTGELTRHAVQRELPGAQRGQTIFVLTDAGRAIFCAHLAACDPWTVWPADFVHAVDTQTYVSPPVGLDSWQFHMVNLLWRYKTFAFRRSDLVLVKEALYSSFQQHPHSDWFPALEEDGDVIQHVNKTGQWGLKHQHGNLHTHDGKSVGHYWLREPLSFETAAKLRSKGKRGENHFTATLPACDCPPVAARTKSEVKAARDLSLERSKVIDYLHRTWVAVPETAWTLEGHRDPDNKELHELIAQPQAYNRASRDKFKFDEYGLPWCPAVGYLIDHLTDFYPSLSERETILRSVYASLNSGERNNILTELMDDLD